LPSDFIGLSSSGTAAGTAAPEMLAILACSFCKRFHAAQQRSDILD